MEIIVLHKLQHYHFSKLTRFLLLRHLTDQQPRQSTNATEPSVQSVTSKFSKIQNLPLTKIT
jgi:hypothetical protein